MIRQFSNSFIPACLPLTQAYSKQWQSLQPYRLCLYKGGIYGEKKNKSIFGHFRYQLFTTGRLCETNGRYAHALAQKIVDMGILTAKSFDDCLHIAAAVVNNCDCIASWNFKRIVNIKTIHGIRAVANLENYKSIDIVSPTVLLEGDNDYEGSISKS